LIQLVTTFCRSATTEHGSAIREDELYIRFAHIFSESCGGAEEDDDEGEEGGSGGGGAEGDPEADQLPQAQEAQVEEDEGASIHVIPLFLSLAMPNRSNLN
jgi:hypothetical protein